MAMKAAACPEPPAASTAERMFSRGGSALDAAVAGALVQGVTNPLGCGLAGMAHIVVARRGWPAPRFLNASVAVGSRAEPHVFEAAFLGRSEP
jgi:gamma-glutamyltranspeptidase/glutathione hydrolase